MTHRLHTCLLTFLALLLHALAAHAQDAPVADMNPADLSVQGTRGPIGPFILSAEVALLAHGSGSFEARCSDTSCERRFDYAESGGAPSFGFGAQFAASGAIRLGLHGMVGLPSTIETTYGSADRSLQFRLTAGLEAVLELSESTDLLLQLQGGAVAGNTSVDILNQTGADAGCTGRCRDDAAPGMRLGPALVGGLGLRLPLENIAWRIVLTTEASSRVIATGADAQGSSTDTTWISLRHYAAAGAEF